MAMVPSLQIGLLVVSVTVFFAIVGPMFFPGALKNTRYNLENISLQDALTFIKNAMALLLRISFVVILVVVIFAFIGLESYASNRRKTCYNLKNIDEEVKNADNLELCNPDNELLEPVRVKMCDYRKNVCLKEMLGPNYGSTSFVNKGFAILGLCQCLALKGWTLIFYWMKDTLGCVITWIYCIALIILGSILMFNSVLRVINRTTSNAAHDDRENTIDENSSLDNEPDDGQTLSQWNKIYLI